MTMIMIMIIYQAGRCIVWWGKLASTVSEDRGLARHDTSRAYVIGATTAQHYRLKARLLVFSMLNHIICALYHAQRLLYFSSFFPFPPFPGLILLFYSALYLFLAAMFGGCMCCLMWSISPYHPTFNDRVMPPGNYSLPPHSCALCWPALLMRSL